MSAVTIRLFDVQNGQVVPTEHCYILESLKAIMNQMPDDYLKVYQYLFYMTCPNPELNPFFNVPTDDKEELVLKEIDAGFSTDEPCITRAIEFCEKLYSTPTSRAYYGIASMLDRLATYMGSTPITHGRDGNINSLVAAAKNFEAIRSSFKGAYKDLIEEQQSQVRGGAGLAYDQM